MNKLIQATIVLCITLLLSSCAKMETINFNKTNNTRTVKFTFKNGKTKLVNQKFHTGTYNWFEAKCFDEKIIEFKNCPDNKIDFTKVGKMMIAQIENKENLLVPIPEIEKNIKPGSEQIEDLNLIQIPSNKIEEQNNSSEKNSLFNRLFKKK